MEPYTTEVALRIEIEDNYILGINLMNGKRVSLIRFGIC